jgi:diaminohydroxyphosphoribosylaminopyrimidine deaminase/5-amino-6-(5-phosphoribosylamino)uracil reductase
MATPAEAAAMRRAIALSAAGLGATSPNPPVGCVILGAGNRVVGEGYHERKGQAHAEVQALAAAGPDADSATAVVTLEPCNHQGRTPPCREALINSRVKRVVIALLDPTSRGEGGAAVLRAAGIDVETGVLADEARVVLGTWLTGLESRRPVITWPYLVTGSGVISFPETTAEARSLRLNADAVLRADGTVGEAVPGSHGANILELKTVPPGTDVNVAAASLYDGGVRHLLLQGGLDVAAPFLATGLLDRLLAYVPDGSASRRPKGELPWPQIPPGFTIREAAKIDGYVKVEARPVPASLVRHIVDDDDQHSAAPERLC